MAGRQAPHVNWEQPDEGDDYGENSGENYADDEEQQEEFSEDWDQEYTANTTQRDQGTRQQRYGNMKSRQGDEEEFEWGNFQPQL